MPRVIVVGSSNTDMIVRAPKLPSAGQTVLGGDFSSAPGGKGANQAVAARRAGADVAFVTAVGDDDLGRRALALYRDEGVDVGHARIVAGARSGVALICVDEDGENAIVVAPGANRLLAPEDIDRLPAALFAGEGVLLASLEVPLETALRALARGREAGMITILNPAPIPADVEGPPDWLAVADLVTPNRLEALALAGTASFAEDGGTEPDWHECARRLLAAGAPRVAITLGARGCLVASRGAEPRLAPAPRVEAVDTVGAGDAFNGALAVALGEGRPLEDAAAWATAAAALAVTRPGAQGATPFRHEIDRFADRERTRIENAPGPRPRPAY